MNELEKRAKAEHKTVVERIETVKSTAEYDALVERVRAQGGHIISTRAVVGKDNAISVQYQVLQTN